MVLSNNDGCVIARSAEAKALGIPMGAPAFQWKEHFKANGVEVFSSNYALYGDMSRRVMTTLALHAPSLEVYSIDEAFLALDGLRLGGDTLEGFAGRVRATVRQWTKIPVGVGIGATKVLAKVANRAAKKADGVFVLDHETTAGKDLLEAWPCEEVWGIARRTAEKLASLGIVTAGQLSRAKRSMIRQRFGVVGERLVLELQGVSCLALEEVQPKRQNICCSRSFGRPVEDLQDLHEAVATFASRAGEKLRRQNLAASAVQVFLATNPHKPEEPQHFPTAGRPFLVPTSFTPEIIGEASKLLRGMYREGRRYAKAGILCLGLVPDEEKQGSLFRPVDPEAEEKQRRLMAAVDKLNLHYGRGTVRSATAGFKQGWQMRQQQVSPHYTTRWKDLPVVRL